MGETPEGPMPGRQENQEREQAAVVRKHYDLVVESMKNYNAVAELVKMLRGIGVIMHAKCPRCGHEGSISVIRHNNGYNYIVIRHPDKSTHLVPRDHVADVLRELCEVKKDLEYILKRFEEYEVGAKGKVCVEGGQ
jgi:hypothetical protein